MAPSSISAEILTSVVYVSSGAHQLNSDELTSILQQARRNNERDGLTGMLLYRGGNFLQVLEGPQQAVDAALSRIWKDPRHQGLICLRKSVITERNFPDWSMGFREMDAEHLQNLEGYNPFMELSFDSEEIYAGPDFGYHMLLQFKQKMR